MMRLHTMHRVVIAVISGAMIFFGGCAEDQELPGLHVQGNQFPELNPDGCQVKVGGGGQMGMRSFGILDLSLTNHYIAFLALEYLALSDKSVSQTNIVDQLPDSTFAYDGVNVYGFELNFVIPPVLAQEAAAVAPGLFTQLGMQGDGSFTTFVGASTYLGPSVNRNSVKVTLVPDYVGQFLRALPRPTAATGAAIDDLELVVEVVPLGRREDGDMVRGEPWSYLVKVCNGCLVSHDVVESAARNPFYGAEGTNAVEPTCELGNDSTVSSVWCGAMWGPGGLGEAERDRCALDRCLGLVESSAEGLMCATDRTTLRAYPPVFD